MYVEQQRSGCVARIGRVDLSTRQAPQQETVDGAESQPPGLGARPGAVDVIQDPGDLCRRKIRIQAKARLRGDQCLVALISEPPAVLRRAPVLPDNRRIDAVAGFPVPEERRLPLVGDPQPGEACATRVGERLLRYLED